MTLSNCEKIFWNQSCLQFERRSSNWRKFFSSSFSPVSNSLGVSHLHLHLLFLPFSLFIHFFLSFSLYHRDISILPCGVGCSFSLSLSLSNAFMVAFSLSSFSAGAGETTKGKKRYEIKRSSLFLSSPRFLAPRRFFWYDASSILFSLVKEKIKD